METDARRSSSFSRTGRFFRPRRHSRADAVHLIRTLGTSAALSLVRSPCALLAHEVRNDAPLSRFDHETNTIHLANLPTFDLAFAHAHELGHAFDFAHLTDESRRPISLRPSDAGSRKPASMRAPSKRSTGRPAASAYTVSPDHPRPSERTAASSASSATTACSVILAEVVRSAVVRRIGLRTNS